MQVTTKLSTAAAATATLAFLATTSSATAAPGDHPQHDQYCAPNQVDLSLSPPDSAMGKTSGEIVFRAKPGIQCLLEATPVLTFQDATGHTLPIPVQYTIGRGGPVVVDDRHPAATAYTYSRMDERTGDPLHGPVPTFITVTMPGPSNTATVQLPWTSHMDIPTPVDVNPVLSR